MALDLKNFTSRFIDEARDRIQGMLAGLTGLERDPTSAEALQEVFRSAHTIKGSARMLKLGGITDTAHKLEDLLDALRQNRVTLSPERLMLLFQGVDAISGLVDRLATDGVAPPMDRALGDQLAQAAEGAGAGDGALTGETAPPSVEKPVAPQVTTQPPPLTAKSPESPPTARETATSAASLRQADSVRIRIDKLDDLVKLMGEVHFSHARLQRQFQALRTLQYHAAQASTPTQEDWQDHLEALRRCVSDLRSDLSSQELLMEELGSKTLIMRMLPLGMLFESSSRLLRDMARSLGKEVECVVVGAEIELDRQVIDRLSDPLVHLLRNALDHGIEPPAERLQAGKPSQGRMTLSARQDGRHVVIEIIDDGRGLNLERIRAKAVQKGLLHPDHANTIPEAKLMEMIFLPGFSTSPIITDLSGRGVGMDVVRKSIIEELHGEIGLTSTPGAGTTIALRLPLSLAMMRVLLCRANGLQFGFIAPNIGAILRVETSSIQTVSGYPTITLDNEFIPVVPLADLLELPPAPTQAPGVAAESSGRNSLLVLVLKGGKGKLGVVVEALVDEQDMVIKPLPEHLSRLTLVNAMVLTAANELVSILQVPALLDRAHALRQPQKGAAEAASAQPEGYHILVVDDSLSTREIEKDVLESSGYRVTLAEDGLDGWQKAMADHYDAILTDVEMPVMDGFALTTRLRQEERYRHVPIIIITSRAQEADKQRGILAGANAYIIKGSFDQGNLLDTLHNLLA